MYVGLQVKEQSPPVDLRARNGHGQPVYKWFYEGRNGWWQYKERASDQIEEAFLGGQQTIEVFIAEFIGRLLTQRNFTKAVEQSMIIAMLMALN